MPANPDSARDWGLIDHILATRSEAERSSAAPPRLHEDCGHAFTGERHREPCELRSNDVRELQHSLRKRFRWGSSSMLDEIAVGLAQHKLIPFFGAGVSAGQLRVVWRDVANEMADALALPTEQRENFPEVAEKYLQQFGQLVLVELLQRRLIASEFDDVKGWPHLMLLSLNAGVLYTTNQDNLFELAAAKKGRPIRVVVTLADLAASVPGEALLLKYHGDLWVPDSVIFTRSSYDGRIADRDHFLNIRMRSDLLAKGFLFIGYSFQDDNVRLLFREVQAAFGGTIPPSYLIAYRYDPSMEILREEFDLTIIDPMKFVPHATGPEDAFTRFLKECSDRVLQLKVEAQTEIMFAPGPRLSSKIATEFEVDTVVKAADGPLVPALSTFRTLLDRTMIPDSLEPKVTEAFKKLCENSQSDDDLQAISGAIFNLSLSAQCALDAVSSFVVAINRINPSGFPRYPVISAGHADIVTLLAGVHAIISIKHAGGKIGDAVRMHMRSWMPAYKNLPPELQGQVRSAMESAWADTGSSVPEHLFDNSGPLPMKGFEEIYADLIGNLPKGLGRPKE